MTQPLLVPTPGQTVGPFFGFALPYPGGEQLVPRITRTPCDSPAGCSTGTATRCPMRCSRSGRPTPLGASSRPAARCTVTATRSLAGGAPRPTQWPLYVHHAAPRPDRSRPGPVHRHGRVCPRPAQPALHPRLPPRRDGPADGWQSDPLLAGLDADRRATLVAERDGATCTSTSGYRASARPSSCATRGTRNDRPVVAGRRACRAGVHRHRDLDRPGTGGGRVARRARRRGDRARIRRSLPRRPDHRRRPDRAVRRRRGGGQSGDPARRPAAVATRGPRRP